MSKPTSYFPAYFLAYHKNECIYISVALIYSMEQTVTTFTQILADWHPLRAVHRAQCSNCHNKNQKRKLVLKRWNCDGWFISLFVTVIFSKQWHFLLLYFILYINHIIFLQGIFSACPTLCGRIAKERHLQVRIWFPWHTLQHQNYYTI